MQRTEEENERIALIAEGCKVSQNDAEAIWIESQRLPEGNYEAKVKRIREMAQIQRMKLHSKGRDNKTKASGE